MADLRALFERLGYRDVRTLLNSGNVVYTAPISKGSDSPTVVEDSIARIERAIATDLEVVSRVTVLTADEVARAIDDNPLAGVATNPSRFLFAVLSRKQDGERLRSLTQRDWSPDALGVGERVAYLWCAQGILESRLPAEVSRALGDAVTSRNLSTMLKIRAILDSTRDE